MPKLSKQKWRFASSLRGMPLKTFRAVERFKVSTVLVRARKYLDDRIWMKLDRGKPMTAEQAKLVGFAVNKAMLELVANYPFEIPVFRLARRPIQRIGFKQHPTIAKTDKAIYCIKAVDLIVWPSVSTQHGTAYKVKSAKFKNNGRVGSITFSGHAIERLMERVPGLNQIAREERADVVLSFLEKITSAPVVDEHTTMLKADKYGHFPMVWDADKQIWVCTTFLETRMDGTPENRRRGGLETSK